MMAQQEFSDALRSIPTTQKLRPTKERRQKMAEIGTRQCKLGELCRSATLSRPAIRARLAQLAAEVNSLQCSDIYRINDLIETVEERQLPLWAF